MELVLEIVNHCDFATLKNVRLTCSLFKQLAEPKLFATIYIAIDKRIEKIVEWFDEMKTVFRTHAKKLIIEDDGMAPIYETNRGFGGLFYGVGEHYDVYSRNSFLDEIDFQMRWWQRSNRDWDHIPVDYELLRDVMEECPGVTSVIVEGEFE